MINPSTMISIFDINLHPKIFVEFRKKKKKEKKNTY